MSAKPCNRCDGPIVFGTDEDTGRVIPLSVGAKVYRVVKENIVKLDPKALVPHVCNGPRQIKMEELPAQHFSEPKQS